MRANRRAPQNVLCRWGDPEGRHGSGDSHPPHLLGASLT